MAVKPLKTHAKEHGMLVFASGTVAKELAVESVGSTYIRCGIYTTCIRIYANYLLFHVLQGRVLTCLVGV